jgi:TRAP-type C4-dicarboxylate transport system permease small subunit
MRRVLKIVKWLEMICLFGSAVAVGAIMFLTVLDVLLRKLTSLGVPGLYEVTQDYLMVALVFLSISHVYRRGGHVRVTLFQGIIPGILRKPLQIAIDLLILAFLLIIVYASYNAGISAWKLKELSSNILAYPLAPALFMVPLGCGLTALRVLQSLFWPQSLMDDST